jgi:hypothetical protein
MRQATDLVVDAGAPWHTTCSPSAVGPGVVRLYQVYGVLVKESSMRSQAIMWSLLLLVATGCAKQEILIPAPTAQDVPGTLYTAQAAHAGVSVSVSSK